VQGSEEASGLHPYGRFDVREAPSVQTPSVRGPTLGARLALGGVAGSRGYDGTAAADWPCWACASADRRKRGTSMPVRAL
jgi:hypothetical protein